MFVAYYHKYKLVKPTDEISIQSWEKYLRLQSEQNKRNEINGKHE